VQRVLPGAINKLEKAERELETNDCPLKAVGFSFFLLPPGFGVDCHRPWESMLVGSIPVVPSSSLAPVNKDLPLVWRAITGSRGFYIAARGNEGEGLRIGETVLVVLDSQGREGAVNVLGGGTEYCEKSDSRGREGCCGRSVGRSRGGEGGELVRKARGGTIVT